MLHIGSVGAELGIFDGSSPNSNLNLTLQKIKNDSSHLKKKDFIDKNILVNLVYAVFLLFLKTQVQVWTEGRGIEPHDLHPWSATGLGWHVTL